MLPGSCPTKFDWVSVNMIYVFPPVYWSFSHWNLNFLHTHPHFLSGVFFGFFWSHSRSHFNTVKYHSIPRVWVSIQSREIPQLVRTDVVNRQVVLLSWWDSYNTIEYVLISKYPPHDIMCEKLLNTTVVLQRFLLNLAGMSIAPIRHRSTTTCDST